MIPSTLTTVGSETIGTLYWKNTYFYPAMNHWSMSNSKNHVQLFKTPLAPVGCLAINLNLMFPSLITVVQYTCIACSTINSPYMKENKGKWHLTGNCYIYKGRLLFFILFYFIVIVNYNFKISLSPFNDWSIDTFSIWPCEMH